ncbi:MAG: sarcosine oxidase, subunit gamma [bacterium]|nr:MAG: sarcosine oxidase, subunit gamma [bacterium]
MTGPIVLGSGVELFDLSARARVGWKGPRAFEWLRSQGMEPPPGANRWMETADGCLIARLGGSEFLAEDSSGGGSAARLRGVLENREPGVYPVPRYDTALLVAGPRLMELFSHVCALDLRPGKIAPDEVCFTTAVGIGVLLMPISPGPEFPHGGLRLWCDGSYGDYLRETLTRIGEGLR